MADYIVIFNDKVSPQTVIDLIKSISADKFKGRTDFLDTPDLSAVSGLAQKYWKVVGTDVVAMTAGEQTDVDTAEAATKLTNKRNGAKASLDADSASGAVLRAILLTIGKTVADVKAQIDAGNAD